jgi:hypothetical protein
MPLTSTVADVGDTPPRSGQCTVYGEPLDQALIDVGSQTMARTGPQQRSDHQPVHFCVEAGPM